MVGKKRIPALKIYWIIRGDIPGIVAENAAGWDFVNVVFLGWLLTLFQIFVAVSRVVGGMQCSHLC